MLLNDCLVKPLIFLGLALSPQPCIAAQAELPKPGCERDEAVLTRRFQGSNMEFLSPF